MQVSIKRLVWEQNGDWSGASTPIGMFNVFEQVLSDGRYVTWANLHTIGGGMVHKIIPSPIGDGDICSLEEARELCEVYFCNLVLSCLEVE